MLPARRGWSALASAAVVPPLSLRASPGLGLGLLRLGGVSGPLSLSLSALRPPFAPTRSLATAAAATGPATGKGEVKGKAPTAAATTGPTAGKGDVKGKAPAAAAAAAAVPAKGGAAGKDAKSGKSPAAPSSSSSSSSTSGSGSSPSGTGSLGVDSSDDMMTDEQRARSLAHRKRTLLPDLASRVAAAPDLYSAQRDLNELTARDVGRFVQLDDPVNRLPWQILKPVRQEFDLTGDFLLFRPDLADLFFRLRKGVLTGESVLVDGGRGGGKSVTLALCVALAQRNRWLLLPTCGEEFIRDRLGQIGPNRHRDGLYDQPRYTLKYLRWLRDGQPEQLRAIRLKRAKSYGSDLRLTAAMQTGAERGVAAARAAGNVDGAGLELGGAGSSADSPAADDEAGGAEEEGGSSRRSKSGAAVGAEGRAPETLFDLVSIAASGRVWAARLLPAVINEVRSATEVRVLVAVDGVNWWDHRSELLDPTRLVPLTGRQLALPDAFMSLFHSPPVNGTCLFATTMLAKGRHVRTYLNMASMQFVSGGYHDGELWATLRHLAVSKVIVSTVDADYRNRAKALSGNVPRDVLDFALLT